MLLLRSKIAIRMAHREIQFGLDISGCGAEVFEVEELVIEQM